MSYWMGETRATEDEHQDVIRLVGGTAAITELFGRRVTLAYVSTGVFTVQWQENPGPFLGMVGFGFDADTPADLKGFTLTHGAFPTSFPQSGGASTSGKLTFNIWNSSFALADLTATQRLTVRLAFRQTTA